MNDVQHLITLLQAKYNVRCNQEVIAGMMPESMVVEIAVEQLLGLPLKEWTRDSEVAGKLVAGKVVPTDTLLEIHSGVNISQPGTVSIIKANSTAKLILTDGYNSFKSILMKGMNADFRDLIGRKILVSAGNTVTHGVLMLKNYNILDSSVNKMEIEPEDVADQEQQEDQASHQ